MPEPSDNNEIEEAYRKFGAGKGLPEFIQQLNIFYAAVITITLCLLAIIVSITFAICYLILDKAL